MTDEEKARELAIKSTRDVDGNGNEIYNVFVEAALQEMSAWKEQQMIEKAVYKCAAMLHKIDDLLRAKGLKGQFEDEFDEEYKKFEKAMEEN